MHIQAPKPGKEHENHKVVYLSQIVTEPKIAQSRQVVSLAINEQELYAGNIVNVMKTQLDKAFKDLTTQTAENYIKNSAFLELVRILEDNCQYNNYYSYQNFLNNSKIFPPKAFEESNFNIINIDKASYFLKYLNFQGNIPPKREGEDDNPPLPGDNSEGCKKVLKIQTLQKIKMIIILQDGKLAIGMSSGAIIIYNLKENKNDFTILFFCTQWII